MADLAAPPTGGQLAGDAQALESAFRYAAAEKSDNTRRAYRGAFERFVAYASRAQKRSLPASPATVAAYLAECADAGLKVSTVQLHAAAIAYAHRLAGEASPLDDETVKAVLRGIRRTLGVAPKQKAPATAEIVSKMVRNLPDTLTGKRDKALLLIGFAAALRRSEIVGLNVSDVERTAEGAFLLIRRSKGDQEGRGARIAVPNGAKLKPLEALDAWLAEAAIVEGPLFRSVSRHGKIGGALSAQSVALIVKQAAKAAKLDPALYSGHSVRAGYVTSALKAGADLLRIMDQTRHRNTEILRGYDRRLKAYENHSGKSFL